MLCIYLILAALHLGTAISFPTHNAQHVLSSPTLHIHTNRFRPNIFVHFQATPASQSTSSARVTKLNWKSTVVSVTRALQNISAPNGGTDILWVDFAPRSLMFAGFLDPGYTGIVPQAGLDRNDTAVTLILPSAILPSVETTSKISKITPQLSRLGSGIAKRCAISMRMFGISGRLTTADYAYATGKDVREALLDLDSRRMVYLEAEMSGQAPSDGDTHDLRLNAVRSDGSSIVVHLTMR